MPMVPGAILSFLTQIVPLASWGIFYNQLTEPCLQMVLHDMRAPPKSGQLQCYSPFSGTSSHEIFPVGRTYGSTPQLCTLLWRRNGQMCDYTSMHGLLTMVWQDAQGLRRNITRKLVTKKFGAEEISPNWATDVKIFVSCEYSPKGDLSWGGGEGFNNQADSMTCFVDTSQPFSPATCHCPGG